MNYSIYDTQRGSVVHGGGGVGSSWGGGGALPRIYIYIYIYIKGSLRNGTSNSSGFHIGALGLRSSHQISKRPALARAC